MDDHTIMINFLERLIPAKSVTSEHHPREGFLKQPLCTISVNIFSAI